MGSLTELGIVTSRQAAIAIMQGSQAIDSVPTTPASSPDLIAREGRNRPGIDTDEFLNHPIRIAQSLTKSGRCQGYQSLPVK